MNPYRVSSTLQVRIRIPINYYYLIVIRIRILKNRINEANGEDKHSPFRPFRDSNIFRCHYLLTVFKAYFCKEFFSSTIFNFFSPKIHNINLGSQSSNLHHWIRIQIQCIWIRIQVQCIWIHNTGVTQCWALAPLR